MDKARRRMTALLEANAQEIAANRKDAIASLEREARLKANRVTLLRLYAQFGGDPEPYEMEGAEVTG